jgi:XapX domain-containing protein
MHNYLVAIALGLLAGVIYGLFNVRSPAPPVVALIGLLGMLIGEQIPPLVKQVFQREVVSTQAPDDEASLPLSHPLSQPLKEKP